MESPVYTFLNFLTDDIEFLKSCCGRIPIKIHEDNFEIGKKSIISGLKAIANAMQINNIKFSCSHDEKTDIDVSNRIDQKEKNSINDELKYVNNEKDNFDQSDESEEENLISENAFKEFGLTQTDITYDSKNLGIMNTKGSNNDNLQVNEMSASDKLMQRSPCMRKLAKNVQAGEMFSANTAEPIRDFTDEVCSSINQYNTVSSYNKFTNTEKKNRSANISAATAQANLISKLDEFNSFCRTNRSASNSLIKRVSTTSKSRSQSNSPSCIASTPSTNNNSSTIHSLFSFENNDSVKLAPSKSLTASIKASNKIYTHNNDHCISSGRVFRAQKEFNNIFLNVDTLPPSFKIQNNKLCTNSEGDDEFLINQSVEQLDKTYTSFDPFLKINLLPPPTDLFQTAINYTEDTSSLIMKLPKKHSKYSGPDEYKEMIPAKILASGALMYFPNIVIDSPQLLAPNQAVTEWISMHYSPIKKSDITDNNVLTAIEEKLENESVIANKDMLSELNDLELSSRVTENTLPADIIVVASEKLADIIAYYGTNTGISTLSSKTFAVSKTDTTFGGISTTNPMTRSSRSSSRSSSRNGTSSNKISPLSNSIQTSTMLTNGTNTMKIRSSINFGEMHGNTVTDDNSDYYTSYPDCTIQTLDQYRNQSSAFGIVKQAIKYFNNTQGQENPTSSKVMNITTCYSPQGCCGITLSYREVLYLCVDAYIIPNVIPISELSIHFAKAVNYQLTDLRLGTGGDENIIKTTTDDWSVNGASTLCGKRIGFAAFVFMLLSIANNFVTSECPTAKVAISTPFNTYTPLSRLENNLRYYLTVSPENEDKILKTFSKIVSDQENFDFNSKNENTEENEEELQLKEDMKESMAINSIKAKQRLFIPSQSLAFVFARLLEQFVLPHCKKANVLSKDNNWLDENLHNYPAANEVFKQNKDLLKKMFSSFAVFETVRELHSTSNDDISVSGTNVVSISKGSIALSKRKVMTDENCVVFIKKLKLHNLITQKFVYRLVQRMAKYITSADKPALGIVEWVQFLFIISNFAYAREPFIHIAPSPEARVRLLCEKLSMF